jgi:hypothetical protein
MSIAVARGIPTRRIVRSFARRRDASSLPEAGSNTPLGEGRGDSGRERALDRRLSTSRTLFDTREQLPNH